MNQLDPETAGALVATVTALVLAQVRAELPTVSPTPETSLGWFSDKTAAVYASCSISTVKSWRKRGLDYYIRDGLIRIKRADLDEWIGSLPSRALVSSSK